MNPGEQASEPPALYNLNAEAATLGSIMVFNDAIGVVSEKLRPEHFGDPVHAKIYRTILHLNAAGDAATPVTVSAYMPDHRKYLAELTTIGGAGLIGLRTMADQILEFAVWRAMREHMNAGIARLEKIVEPTGLFDEHDYPDPIDIAADTSAALMTVVEQRNPHKIQSMGGLLGRIRARHDRARNGESIGAICATVPDLNDIIGGAAPGQMTIIGGRSGMGKTVLACSAAWGYAVNGHATMLISLEMTEDALAMRNAADLTFGMNEPVPFRDMTRNTLTESQLLTIDAAAERIETYPFHAISPGRVTIEQIDNLVARHVAKLKREGRKLEVVVVDYIQIVAPTGRLDGTARINHISEGLLAIAKRYEVHVIALSQLLRDIDKRPDRRPTTADLKESGRIEEDADNVILVYRPEFYLTKEQPDRDQKPKEWEAWDLEMNIARGRCFIIGAKVRMGEPTTRNVRFFGQHQAMRGSEFVVPTYRDEGLLLRGNGLPPVAANDDLDFGRPAMP